MNQRTMIWFGILFLMLSNLHVCLATDTSNALPIDPVGCGYDIVTQKAKECFVDIEYTKGNTYKGYPFPDAYYCENSFFSFYSSDYVKMQENAFNYSVTSEQDFSLDLAFHLGNESLGFGYQSTYDEAEKLLADGLAYFAVSNRIFGNYYCRLQASYEITIPDLATKLSSMPNQCTTTEEFNEYLLLVETTGTHYIIGANFGGMVNFTVSVEKSSMQSMSYSQQEQLLNAGIYNLESNQSIGLSYSQNQTASMWTQTYADTSFNSTIYRGGVYSTTGNYNDWAESLSNYTTNIWLPFCNSLVTLDAMVPLHVPETKRECFSNAIWSYWTSFGSGTAPSKYSPCHS